MTNDSTDLLTCGKEYKYGTHMTGNNGPLYCCQSNTRFSIQIQEYSEYSDSSSMGLEPASTCSEPLIRIMKGLKSQYQTQ